MKKSIFKGKSTRTKIFTVITLVGIVLLLGLNFGLTYLGGRRLFMADLTTEGFYTLSDKMIEVCHDMLDPDENGEEKEITITFCTDPDHLISSDSMRPTYFMALALQKEFDNVTVKEVNVANDPTAVSMYRTTSRDSITAADVIFSHGGKYRIADATGFWTSDNFSYDGEYRVASIIASLTAINKPVAYFVSDHGTKYYNPDDPDSAMSVELGVFADLLIERGLEIRNIELSKLADGEEIPEDCAILIINNPTEDFVPDNERLDEFSYVSELEKIDRYLMRELGAVMINMDYSVKLPQLENFCEEWGISFGHEQVFDEENVLFNTVGAENDASVFAGTYDSDEANFGYAYYGKYSTLASAPNMVFSNTGYVYCSMDMSESMIEPGNKHASRNYAAFIGTSEDAYYQVDGIKTIGERTLVAAGVRTNLNEVTSEKTMSYMFCSNSRDFFSNDILGNTSYANYDILASVITNISRTDRYATNELGGTSLNNYASFGGKQTETTELSDSPTDVKVWDENLSRFVTVKHNKGLGKTAITVYTVIIMAIPVAILSLGIVVFIKRKFL